MLCLDLSSFVICHLSLTPFPRPPAPRAAQSWKGMSDDLEHRIAVPRFASDSMDALVKLLEPHHVHFTAKRQVPDVGLRVYFAAKLRGTIARDFFCFVSLLLSAAPSDTRVPRVIAADVTSCFFAFSGRAGLLCDFLFLFFSVCFFVVFIRLCSVVLTRIALCLSFSSARTYAQARRC